MVAKRVVAFCEECGTGYSARFVEDRIVLPTEDGHCRCGSGQLTLGTEEGTP